MTHPTDEELEAMVARLERVRVRMINDDMSKVGTEARQRFTDRLHAMADAAAMLRACKAGDAPMADPDLTSPEAVEALAMWLAKFTDKTSPSQDAARTLRALLARAEAAEARVKELEDDRDDAISVLDAWFDRRKLAHEAVDDAVLDAARGYLRTCRSGGMEQDQSDIVEAVVSDMARLSVFADMFARVALNTGDDNAE